LPGARFSPRRCLLSNVPGRPLATVVSLLLFIAQRCRSPFWHLGILWFSLMPLAAVIYGCVFFVALFAGLCFMIITRKFLRIFSRSHISSFVHKPFVLLFWFVVLPLVPRTQNSEASAPSAFALFLFPPTPRLRRCLDLDCDLSFVTWRFVRRLSAGP
jgi:hypothetical protein